ncbi:carboxypeptidase-like regulatory domain-containing protein [Flavobacterium sp. I3-2]|uniref:carboxypeptidase-like regulatory domain-containing protein n=1 Tax=Flavobacterium sp. I3-2 TaxID=2748319 RepID=UPI0015AD35C4|nr:carboxypeptidase-like regulatory domain-containing protein [Flavobacterium sp. I3-2]
MQKITLFLFLIFFVQMNAQVVSGKIIDSNTKLPLESASIFVENSSIATMSKKDGTFQIDLRGLKNNVVIDYVGYITYLVPKEDLNKNNLTIYLKPSDENLAEMIIDSSPFSRKEMMKCFKKYFLGTTSNGKSCKIFLIIRLCTCYIRNY